MPNKNEQLNPDTQDLERKVDQMMATDMPEVVEPPKAVPKVAEPVVVPAGVPEVPKELSKDLDAFSTEAPDITSEIEPEVETAPPTQQAIPESAAETPPPATEDNAIESKATDDAVTDIVREESDTVLAVDDAANEDETIEKSTPRRWWRSKKFIYGVVGLMLVVVVGLLAWPTSRYAIFNAANVRSKASVKVVDERTNLPLSNVAVSIGSAQAKTDDKGIAAFDMVKLGKQPLIIQRVAFAKVQKDITVGWGSNPLGEFRLQATGARYEFKVTDYLSKKPLKAEASSDDASAVADKNGIVNVVIDNVDKQTVDITVQVAGYRTEKVVVPANKQGVTPVQMVPDKPIVYVSKQSGKYDVYSIDADGQNKKLLLAGTGRENSEMSVALSPDGSQAAIVSTRGTKRDDVGNLLDTLTLVTVKTTASKTLDEAQNIRIVDWVENRLVYVASYTTDSDKNATQQRLIAYNTEESARAALATGTYFSTVASVDGYLYYAPINDDPNQPGGYQRIRVDGSGKQTILNSSVLSALRTGYDTFSLETQDGWFAYSIGAEASKSNAPGNTTGKQYIVSPDSAKSVWLDNRDGKGTLLVRDQKTGQEAVLVAAGGLVAPMRWLNNTTLAYRVANSSETADYVVSTSGGQPRKATNVTNAGGLSINF